MSQQILVRHKFNRGRPKLKVQSDERIVVRLRYGIDDDLIAKIEHIPPRQRSAWLRAVLRGAPADSIPSNDAALDPAVNASLDALIDADW
ncbi:MAG: hypothetical protein JW850_03630 [Thermoflexales bacterium]|nr:hypothetical protein [Thermoflexales bacterium]